jgi:7,8-dihydropterin-6-yl-methyl-4-(beta-D-ribofuranosyl)aminobenzene 5'-phosphate synthase
MRLPAVSTWRAAMRKIIAEYVRDIGAFGLGLIAPGHCTGWRALNALVTAYGEGAAAPLAVGKIFAI